MQIASVILALNEYGIIIAISVFNKARNLSNSPSLVKVNVANKLAIIDKTKEKDIIEEAKKLNIKGKVKYKPKAIDVRDFSFDYNHINSERKHKVTLNQAISYMDNAVVSITRYNGNSINYYSFQGAVYIRKDLKSIRTAFKKEQYDEKIQKMINEVKKDES